MTHARFKRLIVFAAFFSLFLTSLLFATTKKPPLRPININTATSGELQLVSGIGPTTADKILTMRKSYGPFKSVDDLLAIKGLGKKRLDKMRKYLTVGKTAAANHPQTPAAKSKSAQAKEETSIKNPPAPEQPDTAESEPPL